MAQTRKLRNSTGCMSDFTPRVAEEKTKKTTCGRKTRMTRKEAQMEIQKGMYHIFKPTFDQLGAVKLDAPYTVNAAVLEIRDDLFDVERMNGKRKFAIRCAQAVVTLCGKTTKSTMSVNMLPGSRHNIWLEKCRQLLSENKNPVISIKAKLVLKKKFYRIQLHARQVPFIVDEDCQWMRSKKLSWLKKNENVE